MSAAIKSRPIHSNLAEDTLDSVMKEKLDGILFVALLSVHVVCSVFLAVFHDRSMPTIFILTFASAAEILSGCRRYPSIY